MRTLVLSLIVTLIAIPGLLQAQEAPQLPEQLKKFEQLLGNWEGSGTVTMPGTPGPMQWTSLTTVKPILNHKFIQSDMKLSFGGAMPEMVFTAYYGYDANLDKLVSYSIGNTGEIDITDHMTWIDEDSLLQISVVEMEGIPVINRSVSHYSGDTQTFTWSMAEGAGDFKLVVDGSSKRCEKGYEISAADWNTPFMPVPAPEPMQKLARMAGDYVMSGEYVMTPGAAPMKISSRESITSIWGGNGLRMHVMGDPIPGMEAMPNYEAIGFVAWHPGKECFMEFYFSNMGETSVHEMRFVGDTHLVSTSAQMMAGQPEASRGTVVLDESGSIKKAIMERMTAGNAPEKAFTGTYEKVVGEKKAP